MSTALSIPCNFSNGKLSFYIASDFSIPVLERYGPDTKTILFGVIPPNARFAVTRQVLATLVEYADYLPDLECIYSCSGNVDDDIDDDDLIPLVRSFRSLKSIYLDAYKILTDRTFIAILYACPEIEEIIISAGDANQGLLTQRSLGAFFKQPRVGNNVIRVELLNQSPTAFTDDIILPLIYDMATRGRDKFKFWKTAPEESWENWMLPEPGEVGRDEVQRKVAFGPGWFKSKNAKEQLRVFESWQQWKDRTKLKLPPVGVTNTKVSEEKSGGKPDKEKSKWKGSIRKRFGGLL